MKFTRFELLNNTNDEVTNIGMKNKYKRLCNIVNGVDQLLDEADNITKEIIRLRYWECPIGCYEWQDIGVCGFSFGIWLLFPLFLLSFSFPPPLFRFSLPP
ncbi:MAG: hypothetical protein E6478_09800, partial [Staphylococcus epidermidis]|nr:hypothetical protein [Staphylococcus epidermidis]